MTLKLLCLSLFQFISLKFVKYLFQVASINIIFIYVFRFQGALPRELLGGGGRIFQHELSRCHNHVWIILIASLEHMSVNKIVHKYFRKGMGV